MAEFPAMPLWTDAYLGDTTHLTTIEHGAYVLLLITAWRSKAHCLPDDNTLLAQYCKLRLERWHKMRPRLEPFFEITSGYWFHGRLLDEIETLKRLKRKRSVSGSIGAAKRWHRTAKAKADYKIRAPHSTSQTRGEAPKPLKLHEPAIANACLADGKGMAPTPTQLREEATEKEKSQLQVTDHLKLAMERKGWLPH